MKALSIQQLVDGEYVLTDSRAKYRLREAIGVKDAKKPLDKPVILCQKDQITVDDSVVTNSHYYLIEANDIKPKDLEVHAANGCLFFGEKIEWRKARGLKDLVRALKTGKTTRVSLEATFLKGLSNDKLREDLLAYARLCKDGHIEIRYE